MQIKTGYYLLHINQQKKKKKFMTICKTGEYDKINCLYAV